MMRTSEQITYDRLKDLILENKLPRGEFLSQRKLAASVGATTMTLRSSLRLLENDGLVENVPKWGVRIPVETEEAIRDRYFLRELLEVGAVERLLCLNPPNARDILLRQAELCDTVEMADTNSFKDFAEKHTNFHLTIAELSGSKLLVRELARINFRSMMLINAKYGWELQNENLMGSLHRDFVQHLFAVDPDDALDAVRRHIRRGCDKELATLETMLNRVDQQATA